MNPKAKQKDIYCEKLPGETIVYDKATHQAHCLNATVSTVWEHADGSRSVEEIAAILEEKLGIPKNSKAAVLSLEQLEGFGLLETLETAMAPTDVRSRRQVARDLATAGLSITLFPLVASVLAPTPAMAASASGISGDLPSYEKDLVTVGTDIKNNAQAFSHNQVAQTDFKAGLAAGNQGITATLQGNNQLAQNNFQTAVSDFDGVLKALGLGPL